MSLKDFGVVVHVDDERSVRDSLALLLRAAGYEIHSAARGRDALLMAGAGLRPDVLIVDFSLDGEMNGIEAAERLQSALHYPPPVIVLSGDLNAVALPRNFDTPVWLIRKPLNPRLLLAALPGLVQLSRATRPLLSR